MAILQLLLSGPGLIFIMGVISLSIVVRALTQFGGEATDLRARLRRAEQELARLRDTLPEKREALQAARDVVLPLKQENTKMQAYYDRLRLIEHKAAKAQEQEQQQVEEEDIQIHRPGFPSL